MVSHLRTELRMNIRVIENFRDTINQGENSISSDYGQTNNTDHYESNSSDMIANALDFMSTSLSSDLADISENSSVNDANEYIQQDLFTAQAELDKKISHVYKELIIPDDVEFIEVKFYSGYGLYEHVAQIQENAHSEV